MARNLFVFRGKIEGGGPGGASKLFGNWKWSMDNHPSFLWTTKFSSGNGIAKDSWELLSLILLGESIIVFRAGNREWKLIEFFRYCYHC